MTFSYTRKDCDEGMVCTVKTTGYLEIESGDDDDTLSPPMVVEFWCDEPTPGTERQIEIVRVKIWGMELLLSLHRDVVAPLENWCRRVADYQLAPERI